MRARAAIAAVAVLLGELLAGPAPAAVDLSFDYRYDTTGFFAAGSLARSCLEAAADFYESIFDDDLTAITSSFRNHFHIDLPRPDTGTAVTIEDFNVAANTVVVFVGARDLTGNTLGYGGPGGWHVSYMDQSWLDNVWTRGEGTVATTTGPTATDLAPWGGTLTVDSLVTWNTDPTRLPSAGQNDLLSVLLHELGHVLGIAGCDSWDNLDDGSGHFTGAAAVATYGGLVPLQSGSAHWASDTTSAIYADGPSQEAAMDPTLTIGSRKLMTDLDVAGLDDIGWDIHPVSLWTGAGGGAFAVAGSWSTGSVPSARDAVQFRLNAAYTISFGANVSNDRALVQDGDVTFELGGTTYTLDYLMLGGSGASLAVRGGTLRVNRQAWVPGGTSLSIGSGGTLDLRGTASGAVSVASGGSLVGSGCITTTLTNAGLVRPGATTGTLVVGAFRQLANGTLQIELGGDEQGAQYDLLDVNGKATLDGQLEVLLTGGFAPTANETFEVLTYTSRSGVFAAIAGSALPDGLVWLPEYGSLSLVLRAAIPGDANCDGLVSDLDASILASHWQQATGATWRDGDFTGDGKVSDLDASVLAAHWQQGIGAAVPEPSLAAMILGAIAVLGAYPRNPRPRSPRPPGED